MKAITDILKASIPVAIGVCLGMVAYEQVKKLTAKA